ncbi:MAG: histidine kinase [Bacteroidetes bacterium]|nr:histidine kinase [Bacteroidota bacterium]
MLLKKTRIVNDKWFRLLGIPLIALMGHITFFNRNHLGEERFGFWIIYFISLTETYVLWEAIRLVIIYYRKRYPGIENSRRRIAGMLVTGSMATILIRSGIIFLYDKTLLWGYVFPVEGYLYNVFVALLYVIIIGGTYEGIYYFDSWRASAVEAEALRNENLQTQLDSLKAQINPHFLFNSLSSLSSLIAENPRQAEKFVEELSSVYRYLLQTNQQELTTLENELIFINAYGHLLQTRFGAGFVTSISVDKACMQYLLPPLTLQLLLENAVKHNIILPERPLHINIYTEGKKNLVVENNKQKKSTNAFSNKMGLKNISAKYALMKQQNIVIEETTELFRVIIPLIKTESYAHTDSGR